MVKQNEFGRINMVHGSYLQDWLLYETDYNWRLEDKTGGRSRAVADIGSHWCDTVQYVTGKKISQVFADLWTVHPHRKKPISHADTFSGSDEDQADEEYEDIPIHTENLDRQSIIRAGIRKAGRIR
ncbi:Gfo/Idh/MocA family oxidoreductase [Paenibacillus sp. LHD-38]|uniref:Gfo/Idh/MocA family protein n=1 Tax=Paenibacillus sp. LHD-38 TaxID=3072143 RepID=UPI00280F3031|nr:Gfo/Idh/MocA family oxidoreductase [Paenibacillus sp. LHD-38]MDQ8738717.1 Gfo/Idh/MocA family oxidoreductase [Paenibacillus sp. LHD-38]